MISSCCRKALCLCLCLWLTGCGYGPREPEPTPPAPTQGWQLPTLTPGEVADAFREVALGSEYPADPAQAANTRVRKWVSPITYRVEGSPTAEDRAVLEGYFARLAALEGLPPLRPAEPGEEANFLVTFLPPEDFLRACPNADAATNGHMTVWWNDALELTRAEVHIRSDIDQATRSPVILHELTQSLGMPQDSGRESSILYCGDLQVTQLSDLDWLLLRILYCPRISPGMDDAQCREIIEDLFQ